MERSHVLPCRVLDGKAGGMLDHPPWPRKAADHFLWPPAALDEPNYHLRRLRTGHHPANLCRRHRRHHLGAELVSLAEGYIGSETPSHSVRVRFEHRRCFHDDDANRAAGVTTNQQKVRHGVTDLSILYHFRRTNTWTPSATCDTVAVRIIAQLSRSRIEASEIVRACPRRPHLPCSWWWATCCADDHSQMVE
jgi:hypothetical protein